MNRNLNALILVILAIGLYFTVTASIFKEAGLVRDSNKEYETAIKNAEELIRVRDKVLNDYNTLSIEDRAKLDKIVPKNVDNIRLIIDLNNIAIKHGLALKGISVSAGASDANTQPIDATTINTPVLNKVGVTFGISASYQQFISFIQDLESSLRILDLNNLSVTSSDNGVYDWKVNLDTYWLQSK
jgi:Tfp pilus assembly protein PilO